MTLNEANTFTGTTSIAAGTLITGIAGALQDSTLNYVTGGGTLSFGTLTTATLGGLTGNQDLILANATNAGVNVLIGNNNSSTAYSGNLAGSNAVLLTSQTGSTNSNVLFVANTSNTSLCLLYTSRCV